MTSGRRAFAKPAGSVLAVALSWLAAVPATGALYLCGSDTLRVDPVGIWEAVVLHLDGSSYLLRQTIAASGVRYSDGDRTFWTKGENAFLEVDDRIVKDGCVLVPSALDDPRDGAGLLDLPVLSSLPVDVAAMNARVRAAAAAGEPWVREPLLVAMECLRAEEGIGGRVVAIVKSDDYAEMPSRSTVTVLQEGLLDDSVRAFRDELRLVRVTDDVWEVESASRSFRCWRGRCGRSFSAELCP